MSDISVFTEANRKAWNMAMHYHRQAMDEKWDARLADPNYIAPKEPELSELNALGIKGKDIIQLCCNNGMELLSLKRMGAGRCVGIDIADEAIKDASRRAKQFSIDASFYNCSVFDTPEEFNHSFDIVYITIGALPWMPDLDQFFEVAQRLLRPGGHLFMYEAHPFSAVLPWDVTLKDGKAEITNNYFYDSYLKYNESLDYYGAVQYEGPDTYEFMHTTSQILNAIIANGFRLMKFNEYEHDISNGLKWVAQTGLRLPLSYILIAKLD